MKKLLALVLALLLALSIASISSAEELDLPWGDEWITLKVSVFDRGTAGNTPADNNFYTQWIQENFGDPRHIKVEWVVIPRSDEVGKLQTLMAGGEAGDISFTYTESVITNFVQQGGLWELTDLIEEYGPHIKEFLGEDILAAGRFEGGQYAIPARRVVVADQGMFIRADLLRELGLEMPTTKDELADVMAAFKEAYPDKVVWTWSKNLTNNHIVTYSFLTDVEQESFATIPMVMRDGYEDFVLYLNWLYNEGYMGPDFALMDDNALYNEVASGKGLIYQFNYDHPIRVSPGVMSTLKANYPDAEFLPLNCFESVIDSTKYYHNSYNPWGLDNFVPKTCEHPEAAIMYLDWLCEYDTIYFLQNGVQGETYELNEDGIPVIFSEINGDKHFNSMQNIDYTLLVNGTWLDDPSKLIAAQAPSYQYPEYYEEEYIVGNTDLILDGYHFDVVLENDSKYGTTLSDKWQEILTKTTVAAPEECLELFRQLRDEYMAEGGQAVMEEKVAAWEASH